MDATFRMRRSYRTQGLLSLPFFLVWAGLGLWVALTDPSVTHRAAAAALMSGIPGFMTGLTLWMLAAYRRHRLTIRGDRVAVRGVVGRTEIDLGDVTDARWRIRPSGGSLQLRSGAARLAVAFGDYEADDRTRLVGFLRSALSPEVQAGWDLFEYRRGYLRPRAVPDKPGPDEVLLRRGRWDRYFLTMALIAGSAGYFTWWHTGQWRALVGSIVGLAALWAPIRFLTPARGMVDRKLSARLTPDTARFFGFGLLWAGVGVSGALAIDRFADRLEHPHALLVAGGVVWVAVLLFEAWQQDRREARRIREAASRAAGEASPMDLS